MYIIFFLKYIQQWKISISKFRKQFKANSFLLDEQRFPFHVACPSKVFVPNMYLFDDNRLIAKRHQNRSFVKMTQVVFPVIAVWPPTEILRRSGERRSDERRLLCANACRSHPNDHYYYSDWFCIVRWYFHPSVAAFMEEEARLRMHCDCSNGACLSAYSPPPIAFLAASISSVESLAVPVAKFGQTNYFQLMFLSPLKLLSLPW